MKQSSTSERRYTAAVTSSTFDKRIQLLGVPVFRHSVPDVGIVGLSALILGSFPQLLISCEILWCLSVSGFFKGTFFASREAFTYWVNQAGLKMLTMPLVRLSDFTNEAQTH